MQDVVGYWKKEVNWTCFAEWIRKDQLHWIQSDQKDLWDIKGFGCNGVKVEALDNEDSMGLERGIGILE